MANLSLPTGQHYLKVKVSVTPVPEGVAIVSAFSPSDMKLILTQKEALSLRNAIDSFFPYEPITIKEQKSQLKKAHKYGKR